MAKTGDLVMKFPANGGFVPAGAWLHAAAVVEGICGMQMVVVATGRGDCRRGGGEVRGASTAMRWGGC